MTRNLPSPDQILEELADKTAVQIDRRAPVAFDAALDEMTRYHRFLLAVSASRTPEGTPFSYAEVPGAAFRGPHWNWLRQYARLFERAADRIGDDQSFMTKLAYVPFKLLPGEGGAELSFGILKGIIDLGPMLVHRLEAWLTKRTKLDNWPQDSASPQLSLTGSDAKAHANVVSEFIGAWESLLQRGPILYRWRRERDISDQERWATYCAAWPFLWQHLQNTAYSLAIAVWNEDITGAVMFRDALVRWPMTIRHDLADHSELRQRRLLYPEVLRLDWGGALKCLSPILPEQIPAPGPDQLFTAVLRGAHDDAVLLTAALLLFWTMNEKQVTDIGARTAAALLRRELSEPEGLTPVGNISSSFRSRFLDVLRLELAGERFREGSYSAELDNFVASLDNMTERHVVPGRIFTPSTLHDREGLLLPTLAILLAAVPVSGDDGLRARIEDLARNEKALPDADRSLRNALHELDRFSQALQTPIPNLKRGVIAFKPEAAFDASIAAMTSIVEEVVTVIESERLARLKERPVDPGKLERIRGAIEAAILKAPAAIAFFRGFTIESAPRRPKDEGVRYSVLGIDKGELVDPPMGVESSNLPEFIAAVVRDKAASHVLELLSGRRRWIVNVQGQAENEVFWRAASRFVERVGTDPIMLVSRAAQARMMRWLLYSGPGKTTDLRIERKSREDVGFPYIITVEGVDVYGANLQRGTAWLFSAKYLRAVRYAILDNKGRHITLTYKPTDDTKGTLEAEFVQTAKWRRRNPIFEVHSDDPSDGDGSELTQ